MTYTGDVRVGGPADTREIDGLTVKDHQGLLHPTLGDALPSVENGLWKVFADGRMETTYPIRAGAQWHDGTPLTGDDLAFTIGVQCCSCSAISEAKCCGDPPVGSKPVLRKAARSSPDLRASLTSPLILVTRNGLV